MDSEFVGSVTSSKANVESLREIVEIPDSTVPPYPDVPTGIVTGQYADLIAEGEALSDQHCTGASTTSSSASPSTTPRVPPENPRASCTPTAGGRT